MAKYTASGNYIWAKSFGASTNGGSTLINDMVVDGGGNIILCGRYAATVDMNTSGNTLNLISNGNIDILLAVYDAEMNLVWARGIGGSSLDEGYAITVDQNQIFMLQDIFKAQ